jgi:DNA-binding MarR family transcriptional regulator
MAVALDLNQAPGHLIRRMHQIAVAAFVREVGEADITPVQFGLLQVLATSPGLDQITLAKRVALDAATSGSVISRLEAKGWIVRTPDAHDRRRKLLQITPAGQAVLGSITAAVARAQALMLAPLPPDEQVQLIALLSRLVSAHEAAG